jgi:hypothetical protein
MTVCVGIKVHDGIVFAADSASTLVGTAPDGSTGVLNVWRHGNKVFNLRKGLPIVAMTCGMGHIGPASISSLAKDLRKLLTSDSELKLKEDDYTIEEVASKAHKFFGDKYQSVDPPPPAPHSFEFWIGGISGCGARGEIWKLQIADGEIFDPVCFAGEADDDLVVWSGQPGVINRLLVGFDENLNAVLAETGVDEAGQQQFLEALRARAATPLVHAAMPIQDVIALADFLVDTTKRYFAFLPGADVVGGDTDIAAVTKHERFKWIRRKHYYPPALNPRETDHA